MDSPEEGIVWHSVGSCVEDRIEAEEHCGTDRRLITGRQFNRLIGIILALSTNVYFPLLVVHY